MNNILAGLAVSLAVILLGAPLALVIVAGAILVPAIASQQTITCGGTLPATGQWRVPFVDTAYTLTSGFGTRVDPVTGAATSLHNGVDLATTQSPVVAAATGVVTFSGDNGNGFGNHVVLDHGAGITTLYGHLADIDPQATTGATITIGQRLGLEGTTGRSTGIHLHFTITVNGVDIDPVPFMLDHGAPLNGQAVGPSSTTTAAAGVVEGGVGFELPEPEVRQDSLHNPPLAIPDDIGQLYQAAAAAYGLPWTLLAGIGMEETAHGRNTATSTAGAQGLMQFMPATFATYGVDGDGDGTADIHNPADSAYSAANYLVASGVLKGADGVKQALYAYNHADWYVGDVLYYAHAYGGGTILGTTTTCPSGTGNPNLPALSDDRTAQILEWAGAQVGKLYVIGAGGPDAYDCSSLVQNAYARIGITMPRTAQSQRDWLAAGNGYQVTPGQEKPGDLIFISSYLGPNQIGHVAIVWNPANQQTVEAASTEQGVIHGSYTGWSGLPIFEIWRVGNLDRPG